MIAILILLAAVGGSTMKAVQRVVSVARPGPGPGELPVGRGFRAQGAE